MLKELNYTILDENCLKSKYGKGAEMGVSVITTFVVIAIVTVIVYKLFNAKSGDITLPGGYKFKFTT